MKRLFVFTLASLLSVGGFAQSGTATEKRNSLEIHIPRVSFSAFQFDFQMPEGVAIIENEESGGFQASLMSEDTDHRLLVASLGDGKYRFLGFSPTNAELALGGSNRDILLAAQVVGLGNISGGVVPKLCGDILFVSGESEATTVNPGRVITLISTGIRNVGEATADGERWYNLNGQQVEAPGKGLYIRNGEKVMVK